MFLLVCICPDCPRDTPARSDVRCPAPKAEMCFLRRLRRKISPARAAAAGRFLFGNPDPQGGAAEAEHRRAAGRGTSTERVTEGEQEKYGRIGSLRKRSSRRAAISGRRRNRTTVGTFAVACRESGCKSSEWENHALRWSALSSEPCHAKNLLLGDEVEDVLHSSSSGVETAERTRLAPLHSWEIRTSIVRP